METKSGMWKGLRTGEKVSIVFLSICIAGLATLLCLRAF
jgi:hypothetical protein